MPDFKAQADLTKNPDFLDRVSIAIAKAANNVAAEAKNPNKVELYDKRHLLSYNVLNYDMTKVFARAIVSANTDISMASTDDDIQFMTSSVWNNIAGVQSDEL